MISKGRKKGGEKQKGGGGGGTYSHFLSSSEARKMNRLTGLYLQLVKVLDESEARPVRGSPVGRQISAIYIPNKLTNEHHGHIY